VGKLAHEFEDFFATGIYDAEVDNVAEVQIARVCGGDASLTAEVESLLASYEQVGNFLETSAQGGMGAVYKAVRADDQYHKEVAIKLIRTGFDSDFLVRRFKAERQPIDEYCDARKLATVERLNLFRQACSAVQYAHQNLVIHRDLKLGNILVTTDGVPKLLISESRRSWIRKTLRARLPLPWLA
jgi:eukaryotic-like serine/threonine-protein kinase